MSVTRDIMQSWRSPRAVIGRHLARGQSEPFAFSLLVAFLVLAFIAQWPGAAREAFADGNAPLSPRLLAVGLALLAAILPLYAVAAISHLIARGLGGKGSHYGARIALFMALLAASPLMLLHGLTLGLIGPGPQALLVGGVAGAGFLTVWIIMLIAAERQ